MIPRKASKLYLPLLFVLMVMGCVQNSAVDSIVVQNPPYPENNERALNNIEFVKVAEYGKEGETMDAVFGSRLNVLIEETGRVLVLDIQNGNVKAFEPDGTFLWSRLTKGTSPGELRGAYDIYSDGHAGFFIPNQGNTRLDRYSGEAVLLESVMLADLGLNRPNFHGLTDDSTLVFSKFIRGKYAADVFVVRKRHEWMLVDQFVVDVSDGLVLDERLALAPYIRIVDGDLIVPDVDEFRFVVYSPLGEQLKDVTRNVGTWTGPAIFDTENGYRQSGYSGLFAPMRLDQNWLIGQSFWINNVEELIAAERSADGSRGPLPKSESTFDIYSNNWDLIYSLDKNAEKQLYSGDLLTTDKKGHVFVYSSSTGLVTKYKVNISK